MSIKKTVLVLFVLISLVILVNIAAAANCDVGTGNDEYQIDYLSYESATEPDYGWSVWWTDFGYTASDNIDADDRRYPPTSQDTIMNIIRGVDYSSSPETYIDGSIIQMTDNYGMGTLQGTYIYVTEDGYYYPYVMTRHRVQAPSSLLGWANNNFASRLLIYDADDSYTQPLRVDIDRPMRFNTVDSNGIVRGIGGECTSDLDCVWDIASDCRTKHSDYTGVHGLFPGDEAMVCDERPDDGVDTTVNPDNSIYLRKGVYYVMMFTTMVQTFTGNDPPNGIRSHWNFALIDTSHNACPPFHWNPGLINWNSCWDYYPEEWPSDIGMYVTSPGYFERPAMGYIGIPSILTSWQEFNDLGLNADIAQDFCELAQDSWTWDTLGPHDPNDPWGPPGDSAGCCGDDTRRDYCRTNGNTATSVDTICRDYEAASGSCSGEYPSFCETQCWGGDCYCLGDANEACSGYAPCPAYCTTVDIHQDVGSTSVGRVCKRCTADVEYVPPWDPWDPDPWRSLVPGMPEDGYGAGHYEWVFPETYGNNHCNGIDDDCDGDVDADDTDVDCCENSDCSGAEYCDLTSHTCVDDCSYGIDCLSGGYCVEGHCRSSCTTSGDACVPADNASHFTEYGMCVADFYHSPVCKLTYAAKVYGANMYYESCADLADAGLVAQSCDPGDLAGGSLHGGYDATHICFEDDCVEPFPCYPDVDGDGDGGDYSGVQGAVFNGHTWYGEIGEMIISNFEYYVNDNPLENVIAIQSAGSACSDIEVNGVRFSDNNLDCDDANPAVIAAAIESCDTVDNDCDGSIDEGCDDDGDGYADEEMGCVNQFTPTGDLANLVTCAGHQNDCEDGFCWGELGCNSLLSQEDCNNGYNELLGVGSSASPLICDFSPQVIYAPAYAASVVNPGMPEVCDLLDNDCDGVQPPRPRFCFDGDGDGHGDPAQDTAVYCTAAEASAALGGSWVSFCDDCNDGHAGLVDNCCPPGQFEIFEKIRTRDDGGFMNANAADYAFHRQDYDELLFVGDDMICWPSPDVCYSQDSPPLTNPNPVVFAAGTPIDHDGYESLVHPESVCSYSDCDGYGCSWQDCDMSQDICENFCSYTFAFADVGSGTFGGYTGATAHRQECCGDDLGEYVSVDSCAASNSVAPLCCPSDNMYNLHGECVANCPDIMRGAPVWFDMGGEPDLFAQWSSEADGETIYCCDNGVVGPSGYPAGHEAACLPGEVGCYVYNTSITESVPPQEKRYCAHDDQCVLELCSADAPFSLCERSTVCNESARFLDLDALDSFYDCGPAVPIIESFCYPKPIDPSICAANPECEQVVETVQVLDDNSSCVALCKKNLTGISLDSCIYACDDTLAFVQTSITTYRNCDCAFDGVDCVNVTRGVQPFDTSVCESDPVSLCNVFGCVPSDCGVGFLNGSGFPPGCVRPTFFMEDSVCVEQTFCDTVACDTDYADGHDVNLRCYNETSPHGLPVLVLDSDGEEVQCSPDFNPVGVTQGDFWCTPGSTYNPVEGRCVLATNLCDYGFDGSLEEGCSSVLTDGFSLDHWELYNPSCVSYSGSGYGPSNTYDLACCLDVVLSYPDGGYFDVYREGEGDEFIKIY